MKKITKKQLSDFNKMVVRIATELGFKEVPARIGGRKDYRIGTDLGTRHVWDRENERYEIHDITAGGSCWEIEIEIPYELMKKIEYSLNKK